MGRVLRGEGPFQFWTCEKWLSICDSVGNTSKDMAGASSCVKRGRKVAGKGMPSLCKLNPGSGMEGLDCPVMGGTVSLGVA